MTEIKQVKCDNCGKTAEANPNNKGDGYASPPKWFWLLRLSLRYRKESTPLTFETRDCITIEDSKDPDFCSKKCLKEWLSKKIDEISA